MTTLTIRTDISEARNGIEEVITDLNELSNTELVQLRGVLRNRLEKALSILAPYCPDPEEEAEKEQAFFENEKYEMIDI